MGHEENRLTVLCDQSHQQILQIKSKGRINAREWFIHDQD